VLDPGTTSGDAQKLTELECEVRELRRANAILRGFARFFAASQFDGLSSMCGLAGHPVTRGECGLIGACRRARLRCARLRAVRDPLPFEREELPPWS
jgi:hypothetical protein